MDALRVSGYLAKIEEKYKVVLDPKTLIDCGKDACGWEYGDYVFKLTHSSADAGACLAIQQLRRTGLPREIKDGLAKVFEVCQLGQGFWIIITEFLAKPTPEEVTALRQFSGSQRDLKFATPAMVVGLLNEKTLPSAKSDLATRYGQGRIPDEAVDRAYRAWRALALLVRDYRVQLYQDAHAGNFGRDAAGNLKLFDFGDSSFPEKGVDPVACNWGCDPVAQNPTIYETPGGHRRKRYNRYEAESPSPSQLAAIQDSQRKRAGLRRPSVLTASEEAIRADEELLASLANQRPRKWPAGLPLPRNGDILWLHKHGEPTIPVVIYDAIPAEDQFWHFPVGADQNDAPDPAKLSELSPPTRSEMRQLVVAKALAEKERKQKRAPPPAPKQQVLFGRPSDFDIAQRFGSRWAPGTRTGEWLTKAEEEGHFWIELVAKQGWIEKIEKHAGIKLGGMFGCGAFGCAFALTSPGKMVDRYVCKITADQSEGPAQAYIQAGQKKGTNWKLLGADPAGGNLKVRHPVGEWFREGYTVVHTVMTLAETLRFGLGGVREFGLMDRKVYAIIREDINPDWGEEYPAIEDRLNAALYNYRQYAQQFNNAKEKKHGDAELQRNLRGAERHARVVEKLSPSVAAGLLAWYVATGKLQQDVHGGNIGVRQRKEFGAVGDLVIFDPGMSASKKADLAAKKGIQVVRNNPCRSVML